MSGGFGFNLDGPNVTMWVGDTESEPLTDLQINDCIRTLHEFKDLARDHKQQWKEDISLHRVVLEND